MSNCMESFPLSFDWDNKRNAYSSIIAGVLFFSAWWLMIDTAVAGGADHPNWSNLFFLLTAASTLFMFMVNSVSNNAIHGTAMDEGVLGVKGSRLWLMLGFIGSFACIVAGIWIMFGQFVLHPAAEKGKGGEEYSAWPGIALFIHAFMIFGSSLVYKFGRTEELWE